MNEDQDRSRPLVPESLAPQSGRPDNLPGFEALRTDMHPRLLAGVQRGHMLEIRQPASLGSDVGMAHTMTDLRAFATNITSSGHDITPGTNFA